MEWHDRARAGYDAQRHAEKIFGARTSATFSSSKILKAQTEGLRAEFNTLAEQWQRETRHLSIISKKITHPAYFRIMGMGTAVVPLLLESLNDKPAHWFAALQATTNINPATPQDNPSRTRDAWLQWGRSAGYID